MLIKPKDWYSEDYFYPKTRKYIDQFGIEREYSGPSTQWHGFLEISEFVKEQFFEVETIYDVGCSAGSFIDHSVSIGFDSHGCDISNFAIKNCVGRSKERVKIVDITKANPIKESDMVVAFDLLEHIYEKDLDKALEYIYNSCKNGGYFFFCIATARNENEIWAHPDEDTPVPQDKNWLAVSGHIFVQPIEWWIKKLESIGIETLYSTMMKFQLWRYRNLEMSQLESWGIGNIYIGRRNIFGDKSTLFRKL